MLQKHVIFRSLKVFVIFIPYNKFFRMRISIGNKPLTEKPETPYEKGMYFKDLKFKTGNFSNQTVRDIIGGGFTMTYLFKDDEFDRNDHYMSDNYLGTQFICVDIDRSDIPPEEFIEHVQYGPSVVHTTFSNLTERKDYKYCYHLLYFFDEIIYGENNFNDVFSLLTDDYNEHVDRQARDCHRVMFTSNSSLYNYKYIDCGITHKVKDFISDSYDDINDLFKVEHDNNERDKTSVAHKLYTLSTIYKEINDLSPIRQGTDSFNLDSQFVKDMFSMSRGEFVCHYSGIYPYITETYIDPKRYMNGYVDLRNEEYYVVPTSRFRWDAERQKPHIPKIREGFRSTMLWLDIICFMKIIRGITAEHLVYLATTEVYRNFDNSDRQLTNNFIINKCKEVWSNIDNIHVKPVRKTFKIDRNYWLAKGMDNWLSIINHIRRQMKCDDFESLYDCALTVEQNIGIFKDYGVKTTVKTLKNGLKKTAYRIRRIKKSGMNMSSGFIGRITPDAAERLRNCVMKKGLM